MVYFSYSGNTEKIARMIAEDTGAELFQIETVESYPESYDAVLEVAQKEQDENARPELSGHVENIANYEVVYLGWPCWWGNCPMAVLSFLEEYDLSGKTIVPFTTHGGSSWAHSLDTVAAACPNATLLEGLSIQDSDVDGAAGDVSAWLAGLGMVR